MKNVVLVLLLLLLPWQSVVAAERNLTHVLGSGHAMVVALEHLAEHEAHVLYHHDDEQNADGDYSPHVDKSQKSVHHLANCEHGGSMFLFFPPPCLPGVLVAERLAPSLPPDAFSDRTTSPLLRPPRIAA